MNIYTNIIKDSVRTVPLKFKQARFNKETAAPAAKSSSVEKPVFENKKRDIVSKVGYNGAEISKIKKAGKWEKVEELYSVYLQKKKELEIAVNNSSSNLIDALKKEVTALEVHLYAYGVEIAIKDEHLLFPLFPFVKGEKPAINSMHYYAGSYRVETIYLKEPCKVCLPNGAECRIQSLSLYKNGRIKNVTVAQDLEIRLPDGQKAIVAQEGRYFVEARGYTKGTLSFYETGELKKVAELKHPVMVKAKNKEIIKVRAGLTFYPKGSIKEIIRDCPLKITMPEGRQIYTNKLCFNKAGKLAAYGYFNKPVKTACGDSENIKKMKVNAGPESNVKYSEAGEIVSIELSDQDRKNEKVIPELRQYYEEIFYVEYYPSGKYKEIGCHGKKRPVVFPDGKNIGQDYYRIHFFESGALQGACFYVDGGRGDMFYDLPDGNKAAVSSAFYYESGELQKVIIEKPAKIKLAKNFYCTLSGEITFFKSGKIQSLIRHEQLVVHGKGADIPLCEKVEFNLFGKIVNIQ